MIRSFRDRGTENIFDGSNTSAARKVCPRVLWTVARRKLDQLNRCVAYLTLRFHRETDWKFFAEIAAVNSAFVSTISTAFVSTGRPVMPLKSRSRTTTKDLQRPGRAGAVGCARRLPRKRPPTHPGEMLLDEFLKPLGISQSAFAARLGISFPRLNEIIRKKRSVTPDTALRLERVLGMPADFWLGLQMDWDLWHALRGRNAAEIGRLIRLTPDSGREHAP